jgi:hypothetical protein
MSKRSKMRGRCLILGIFLIGVPPALAGQVVFGSGDEPGVSSVIEVRKVESFRVGSVSNSNALNRTFNVIVERDAAGERRARVHLTDIRLGSGSSPDDVARLSGETEVYLMNALQAVPIVLTYNGAGQATGIAGWGDTRKAALDAIVRRVATLQAEGLRLHPDARLSADAVRKIDEQVASGFVSLISKADSREFLQAFYEELAYLLLVAGERVAVGESIEREMATRNPADGSLAKMTTVLRLRKADTRTGKAYFDLKLAGDGIEVLRGAMIAKLGEYNLSDEDIAQKIAAMPMHWDMEGTAVADIKTGRMVEVRVRTRIQVDTIELTSTQEIDIR